MRNMSPPVRLTRGFLITLVLAASNALALANPASEALRARAFDAAYNLDHDEALALARQAVAADPQDAAAHRAVAAITWLNLVFRRGAATVDHYLGSLTKPNVQVRTPPAEQAAIFREHIARALAIAEARLDANPRDVDARYDVGAAVGLLASYSATIEGRLLAAFTAARRAYNAHEEVLRLDPNRKSAALIVGTYRYVVSALSLPVRWMAYVAGFGGGKELGLHMIEEATAYPSEAQTDARFALVLLYNRERRFADALRTIEQLQRQYPRNRLLWLEAGATALRAGRHADAERWLTGGIDRLPQDRRPRMFGEESLWFYKRGATRVALRHMDAARRDLDRAQTGDVQDWVRGRIYVERGKLADLAGDRTRARAEYDRALGILATANDPIGEREARQLRAAGYKD